MISRRRILAGATSAIAATAAMALLKQKSDANNHHHHHHEKLAVTDANYFPNVELTNHLGEKLKFYEDLMKNKFVVINMMYAQCSEGICPISTYNLKKTYAALGDRVGRDIHFYSISLDSVHDTPNVLNKYAKDNNTGDGWQFLTGDYDDIEILRRKLGFFDNDPILDKDRANHAGIIRIGSDHYKRWYMAPALGSYKSIVQVINHAYRTPNSVV